MLAHDICVYICMCLCVSLFRIWICECGHGGVPYWTMWKRVTPLEWQSYQIERYRVPDTLKLPHHL